MAKQFEQSIQIVAAPERVFAAMTDVEQLRQWMPNLVSLTPANDVPMGVGHEWKETRKMFGREASEFFEVTDYDPPRRLGLRVDGSKGTSGKGEYLFNYNLEPSESGTKLRVKSEIRVTGWFARFVCGLLGGVFLKMCLKDLTAMKAFVEAKASPTA